MKVIYGHFIQDPYAFERFAAYIFRLLQPERIKVDEITPRTSDGGRDAIGSYQLGLDIDPVHIKFALEAKCYNPGLGNSDQKSYGVVDVKRLASRINKSVFRGEPFQLGVVVTTSFFAERAYKEIRNDGNPIVLICGKDIVDILVNNDINSPDKVREKLEREYPVHSSHN